MRGTHIIFQQVVHAHLCKLKGLGKLVLSHPNLLVCDMGATWCEEEAELC